MTMPSLPTHKLSARKFPATRLTAFFAAIIALIFVAATNDARAQSYREWTGSGTNWNDSANWNPSGITYAQLEWKGNGNAISWNNAGTQSQWRFYFSGSKAYTLGGSDVNFFDNGGANGGILSDATAAQTINMNVSFRDNGARTAFILTRNTGTLTFGGSVEATSSVTALSIGGTNSTGIISFNGAITGNKPIVVGTNSLDNNTTDMGNTRVIFAGNNTYSGATTVNLGALSISHSNALGATTAGTTVNSGGVLRLTGGVTFAAEALTLAGDGLGGAGALVNTNGNNTWQGTISNTGARIGANANTTLTISGAINSGANNLYLGGPGNITVSGAINGTQSSGNGALWKDGAGTLTLTPDNSGLTGLVLLRGGTISITNANSLGTGRMVIGDGATSATLLVNSNTTRSATLSINNAASAALINVATNTAFTVTGQLTQDGGTANTTKFGKDGAGTLVLAGTGSTYDGQMQIGQGTVILGASSAYGDNTDASGARAIDLGLNIGDTATTNNVALLVSNGVTVSNSFYVAINSNSATRTIGLSGSGSATFSNQFFMDGTLTVDAGASASDSISIVSNITNSGGIIKTNAGILILSASNNYSGGTTLGQGTLRINNARALGTGALTISGASTIDNTTGSAITLANNNTQNWNADFTFTGTQGLNMGTGAVTLGGNRQVTVSANNLTVGGAIGGAFSLTKAGAGTLTLSGANTFSGGAVINAGVLSVGSAVNLGADPASVVTNRVTINGGTLESTAGMSLGNRGITIGASGGTINVGSGGITNTAGLYGSAALAKAGSGTLSLTNTSGSYSGTITVSAGALQVNTGTSLSSADVTVGNTGVLGGAATLDAVTIQSGGRIAPGNSPGNLSVSSLVFEGGSGYNWEMDNVSGDAGTQWDLITVGGGAGTVTFNNTTNAPLTIYITGTGTGFSNTGNYSWTIINAGTLTGFAADTRFAYNYGTINGVSPTGAFSVTNSSGDLVLVYTAPSEIFNVTVAANTSQTQSQATGGSNVFSGVLATLNKLGAGTLVMTNTDNSYTGITTVKEGTLQIDNAVGTSGNTLLGNASSAVVIGDTAAAAAAGFNFGAAVQNDRGLSIVAGTGAADRIISTTIGAGTATQAGTVVMATNTTYSAASGGTLNVSGVISSSGNALITNGGTVVFSGTNTYTGSTTVSSNSTLVAANNTALGGGSGATTVSGGGTLAFSNNINEDEAITISGTGVGGLGALRNLSGANTNTGTITLAAVTNLISADGGSLRLGNINNGAVGNQLTFSNATNTTILLTGNLTNMDTSSTFFKTGTGSLVISNAGATVGGAQLQLGGGTVTLAAGAFSTNTATSPRGLDLGLDGGGVASSLNTAFYINSGVTMSNTTFVAAGSGQRIMGTESTSGTATINGEIFLGVGSTLRVSAATNGTALFSGNIVNTGNVTKIGSGVVALSGANTFAGAVDIQAGTLLLSNASGTAMVDTNAVTISNNATLALGTSETVGSISGVTGSLINLNTSQLRAGENDTSTEFAGVMSSSSDAASFVKKGTGTTTFSGINTMNGQLFLDSGTTRFNVTQGGNFTNLINLGAVGGSASATLSLGASGVTLANPILVRSNTGTTTISALNTTGTATLSGGITLNKDLTIAANSGGNLLITNGALVMSGSGNNDLFITGSNNVTIASVITAPSGASSLNVNGTGVVTLSGDNSANSLMLNLGTVGGTLSVSSLNNLGSPFSYPDKINFNGGTLLVTEDMTIATNTFGMTANSGGGTISVASGKTFTQNSAFTSGNAAGSFNKTGAGTLVLGVTTNQINPTFNIREGTVVVTATGALGGGDAITLGDTSTSGTLRYVGAGFSTGRTNTINAGGGTIDVSNSATLITNTTGMVFNGTFTKAGDGNLVLAGTGSGSGKTIISGGTLSISSGGNLGANPGSVTADAITLAGGTLRTSAGMTLGNRGIAVGAAGGTISVASGTSLTNSSGLNGTGSLVKDGSGLLYLTNTSGNYAGALTVTNGTLQVNTTLRGANISVGHSSSNAGSVLMGAGSVGTVAIGNNGRISPGNSVGILSVSNSLSFNTGGSYLWEVSNTNGTAGTDWDLISVDTESVGGGTLNINGAFTIAGTNIGVFTFNTQTNYPAFQIVRATTLGGTGSLGDLSFSSLGTSLGASGNWAFSFTNGSGLYATYSAPTASLVFTNDSALTQGAANLVTNNNAGDFATITNQGGVTAVVISNTAPVTFTNEANSYTGATTIEQGTLATIVNAGNTTGAFGSNAAAINLGATSGVADATLLIGAAGVTVSKAVDVRSGGSGVRTIGATNASGVATYSGGIALATNVTLSAANSNATTLFSGAISGTAGNVTASGSGVVVLSGANTFSGTTTVSNGATLVAANNAALGNTTGNTVVSSNATLALSNNISTAENISIAGSGVGNSGGALRNLSGNNTNTGTITLSANATIAADSGSTLRLGNINIGTNSRALTFSNEGTILFTGNFANMDTASTFFKNGGGELIISNTSANTGGGQLQQAAGKVTLAAGTFSTNTATGPRGLDFGLTGGGAGSSANTEFYVSGGVTMSNTVYVAGGSGTRTMGTESTAGTATFTGEIYLDNNLTLTAATNGTANFSGSIVNTNGNLTKAGSGTVILSGANTFTGNVDITAGRLNVASGSAIANSAAVTVSNDATLGVTTQEEIGSLAGGGDVSLGSLLIAGGNDASTIYSGQMRNAGGFVKKGTGVMTLSGSSIATGQTFIVNGTLLFAANQGLGFTNIVNLGETSGTDSATLALTNGITLANPLTVRGGSSNNLLTVANLSTSGTTTLSGNVILSNTTRLSSIAGGNVAFTGGTMSFASSTALNVTNTGNVSIANSISAAGDALIAKRGSGTVTLTATNNAGALRYDLYGGELQVGSTGAIGNQTGSFLPNKIYFDGGALGVTGNTTLGGNDGIVLGGGGGTIRVGGGATLTLQGFIQDEARTGLTLSKTGEGTLFLDKGGNNDLGGTTLVVNQGTVSTYNLDLLSSNVQLGSVSGATSGTFNFTKTDGAVTAGNSFAVNSGGGAISVTDNTLTLSGAISGSGALSKTSAGTLTLSGNNTYSGGLTVSAGTLQLNRTGGAALGSVDSISVASGAVLLLSQSSQVNNASAEVTLSGGTIRRSGGTTELFGSLNLTTASFLDYGTGPAGSVQFGSYTPSALLAVSNFSVGNSLKFGNDISSFLPTGGNLENAYFSFNNGFTYDQSTFTITAIPEPSTYLAAAGLLAMFLWPMRRRLIKDAKSILGLRPPARDRFGA